MIPLKKKQLHFLNSYTYKKKLVNRKIDIIIPFSLPFILTFRRKDARTYLNCMLQYILYTVNS